MAMKWYHKKRLLKVAELLESLPRRRFDYSQWVSRDWNGKKETLCRTQACALGHACSIPSLQKAGLRLSVDLGTQVGFVHLKDRRPSWCSPEQAGKFVFGISQREFDQIFTPIVLTDEATAKDVAKLIRYFVENGTCNGFKTRQAVMNEYQWFDRG